MRKPLTRYIVGITLLTLFFILALIGNRALYLNSVETQNQNYTDKTGDEIEIIFRSYQNMTNIIYHEIINTPEIARLLYLSHRYPETADTHRRALKTHVSELYEFLLQYHYRQLHFHLPDTASFLRMHRPGTYGDILYDVRSTVRYVNEHHKPAIGFEEGRIVNGYRFVYPLSYQNKHAGSVEISVSMKAVIQIMEDLFQNTYGFIIKKETVLSKVFEQELDNYEQCGISPDYFIDKAITTSEICRILPETISNKPRKHQQIMELIDREKDFTIYLNEKQLRGALSFVSVKNFEGSHVGYVFSLNDDPIYKHFRTDYNRSSLITILFFLLLAAAFSFLVYANSRFRTMATVDKLTGVYSRHLFYEFYKKQSAKMCRENKTMALIVADIDYFKKVNDTYGHPAGDAALKDIASIFIKNIRSSDIVARWGGEEFLFLLDDISLPDAVKVAEKIRHLVQEYDFGKAGKITCSFGVALVDCENLDIDRNIKTADEKLYAAKKKGRNRVES
jgi:diguanylate cyclase (GGDEF)-like protein